MEQHEIDIEIRASGEVKVHIKGAKGRQCLEYADFFKRLVGEVKERELTHEYYEPEPRVRLNIADEQHLRQNG